MSWYIINHTFKKLVVTCYLFHYNIFKTRQESTLHELHWGRLQSCSHSERVQGRILWDSSDSEARCSQSQRLSKWLWGAWCSWASCKALGQPWEKIKRSSSLLFYSLCNFPIGNLGKGIQALFASVPSTVEQREQHYREQQMVVSGLNGIIFRKQMVELDSTAHRGSSNVYKITHSVKTGKKYNKLLIVYFWMMGLWFIFIFLTFFYIFQLLL